MNYVITGKVRRGKKYGRKIGYPTINLKITQGSPVYKAGIYAGQATLGRKKYRTGIVINNGIEAHLIGYKGNAYGRVATIEIGKFIRKFKKFKTEEELIAQIKKDLKKI